MLTGLDPALLSVSGIDCAELWFVFIYLRLTIGIQKVIFLDSVGELVPHEGMDGSSKMRCAGDLEKAVAMGMEPGETDAGEEAQYDDSVMPSVVVLLSVVCVLEDCDSQWLEMGD